MTGVWTFLLLLPSLILAQEKWWENAVIYQIYPRSLKDNNNDGIGDIEGITYSLVYLASLGVKGIWLSPVYASPMVDFGYDISNFTDIQPEYGTLDEFDALVVEANILGINVIMDFVPNHSSDQHPWFLKSVKREAGYEDYYVWKDPKGFDSDGKPIPPNNWLSAFYGSAWTYKEERGQFYLHQFTVGQPDLNYSNPLVVEEMKDVLRFWMSRGVHGFRIDAVPNLFESPGFEDEPVNPQGPEDPENYDHLNHIYTRNFQATYDMVQEWRELVDAYSAIDNKERFIMVEAYGTVDETMKYFGTAEQPIAHFPFNFNLMPINNETSAVDFRRLINSWIDNVPPNGHNNWLVGNHDSHRVGSRVGADLIDAMNMLVLSLPGTAITYYGEEIGMVNNLAITYEDGKDPNGCNYPPDQWYERSRDFERTPFQWDSTVNAGFNDGAETWLPVHENYMTVNAVDEYADPKSHISVYKGMIVVRQRKVMKTGSTTVQVAGENVLAIVRSLSSREYMVTLVNFGDNPETVNLDSVLLLGPNTTLKVVIIGARSGLDVGDSFIASNVTVAARDGMVLQVKLISQNLGSLVTMTGLWAFLLLLPALIFAQEKWWENGIIYQIYPRSFKDSNNDGIGDLEGITESLAYLASRGVSGIWLSPIYTSPMVDFGYDIANFTDIQPEYGTLEQFDTLVFEANLLGMKVIMDFVPNHSSDQHPWFLKSVKKEAGYEDYYVWRDPKGFDSDGNPIPPNNWLSVFYGSAWEFNEERGQFYLHQFAVGQPDLNYSNPLVVKEMKEVIRFWMSKGVHGFRVDAIPHLFESPGLEDEPVNPQGPEDPEDYDHLDHIYTRNFQATYDMVQEWRELVDAYSGIDGKDRCIMVEAYGTVESTMKYFGTAENPIAHFPFNFNFIPVNNETTAGDFRRLINSWMDTVPPYGHNNWLVGNHDNHRIGSRVGADLIDAMNMMVLSLPGTAITYYGEEIGMVDNLAITYEDGKDPNGCNYPPDQWYQRSRDFERTPFQWDSTVNAGFNDGGETWLPVHENYLTINGIVEFNDPKSHLSVYQGMAELRNRQLMKTGSTTVKLAGENVLLIVRSLSSAEYIVTLINFGDNSENLNLDSVLLLGPNTTLNVVVIGAKSGLNVGDTFLASNVTIAARDGMVIGI